MKYDKNLSYKCMLLVCKGKLDWGTWGCGRASSPGIEACVGWSGPGNEDGDLTFKTLQSSWDKTKSRWAIHAKMCKAPNAKLMQDTTLKMMGSNIRVAATSGGRWFQGHTLEKKKKLLNQNMQIYL